MKDIDKVKFQEIMLGCGEIYNREITKPLLSIYFSALNDLSIEQVITSVGAHIKDTKHGGFFPKPCDIIRKSNQEKNKEPKYFVAEQTLEQSLIERFGNNE